MAIPATRTKNKTEHVYRSILELLCNGVYKPGDKIPDERSLADQFDTGRTVVRDALTRMQARGLIVRRVGSGTYIADEAAQIIEIQEAQVLIKSSQPFNLGEILEARLLFEPDTAALAAINATPSDIEVLNERLKTLQQVMSWLEFKEAIYAVTKGIYEVSGNAFLASVFELVIQYRRKVKYNGQTIQNKVSEIVKKQAHSELKEIVEAIAEKDAKKTKTLSRDYLLRLLTSANL